MKIIRFESENFKRLKAVEIEPDGNLVVISGMNEEGKSSVLDAIWDVLCHRAAKKNIKNPIRTGQDYAETRLDLGEYIAIRKYSKKTGKSTISVVSPNGDRIKKSPQKLLDGIQSDLSFDPWDFAQMKDSEQREVLAEVILNLTKGKIDLHEFDRQKEELKSERLVLNKNKSQLSQRLGAIAIPKDSDPKEEQSVKILSEQLSLAYKNNAALDRLKGLKEKRELLIAELADLDHKIEEAEDSVRSDLESPEIIQEKINKIQETNARAREVIKWHELSNELQKTGEELAKLNAKIKLCDIEKDEAIESVDLGIEGIKVTEEGIMVKDQEGGYVPFSQASAARRLRISLAIGMAANPQLRVLTIRDGSLLDDRNLEIIREMAEDKDYQIWIEYASRNKDDRFGLYIEDGEIV